MNKIIINAVNIHNGGENFIKSIDILFTYSNVTIFCSKKLKLINNKKQDIKFIKIKSNLFSRLLSELSIYKNQKNDKVLYFGNLPPIFKMRAYVYLLYKIDCW